MFRLRLVFVFPLLALPLFAQGLEGRVAQALNPVTGPGQRVELLKEIVNTKGGVEELVKQGGLDPTGDTEVIHALVDTLISADKHLPQLERLCLLLASPNGDLRRKIGKRILGEGENTASATELLAGLRDHVLGVTPAASSNDRIRLGAVRALALVPLRAAVELIVEAWAGEAQRKGRSEAVLAECPIALADVVPARTDAQARSYLAKRGGASYWELRNEVSRQREAELERARAALYRSLKQAPAGEALGMLGSPDGSTRAAAALRIAQLADKGEFSDTKPEEFALRTFEAFVAESARSGKSMEVLTPLAEALAELATAPWKDSSLAKSVGAARIVASLDPLARDSTLPEPLGLSCLRLLDALEEEGIVPLIRFGRVTAVPKLRIEAIRRLGNRARQGAASQARIGVELTNLLGTETDGAVRKQILVSLKQAPVPQAAGPLKKLLLPGRGAKSTLSTIEARDCVAILQQIATKEALEALLAVTATHPAAEVREYAVREALLPRLLSGNGEAAAILAGLRTLVLDDKQPAELRMGVVKAMAERGGRAMHAPLSEFAAAEALPAVMRAAAHTGKLQLALKLVTVPNGQTANRDDLATSVAILAEEAASADPARLEELAEKIIATAAGKIPTGRTRALRALIYARRPGAKEAMLLQRYGEAADAAQPDGLPPADEVKLLVAYRTSLLQTENPSAERVASAIQCSRRLATLAGADKTKAATCLLDAAQDACERLKDKAQTDELLQSALALGPFEGPLATRLVEIKTKAAELK